MSKTTPKTGGVTAGQFFAARLRGGTMTDAQKATNRGYTTIRRIASGENIDSHEIGLIRALAAWSRTVPAAVERGLWIDPIKTARF